MSYDIYLQAPKCPTCKRPEGDYIDLPNPTYNLTPIFDFALTEEDLPNEDITELSVVLFKAKTDRPRGLRILDGRKASETVPQIEKALARMKDATLELKFAALEPPNKWGDLKGALWVMQKLLEAAKEFGDRTWEIS